MRVTIENVCEVFEKEVKSVGGSGGITLPKRYINTTVKVVIVGDIQNTSEDNKKNDDDEFG